MQRGAAVAVIALAAAGASLWGADDPPAAQTAASGGQQAANPHWTAAGCAVCHEQEGIPKGGADAAGVDEVCLRCHDGKRASMEVHPVGRRFGPMVPQPPAGWPAPQGRLVCMTCHDVVQACTESAGRPTRNAAFVRDYDGADLRAWCGRCHEPGQAGLRWNPHTAAHTPAGAEAACLLCHSEAMEPPDAYVRRGEPRLRLEEPALCLGCHHWHVDYFEPGHIGRVMPEEMKEHLAAASPRLLAASGVRTEAGSVGGMALPLQDGGRVVCSTCHNPHGEGVFPEDSLLGLGALPLRRKQSAAEGEPRPGVPMYGAQVALRLPRKDLCFACHER